ncbi:MAG TPA: CAP domain-containing protein [Thermoanaerobaculia bacterium]|nr:CAP domain-containing protein [Thermoanaerobaculia bacterium]
MSPSPAVLLFLLCGAAPPPETTPAAPPREAQEILDAVNALRAARNAPPLKLEPALCAAAQARAEEVARTDDPAAADTSGEAVGRYARAAGYEFRQIGEIVLFGEGSLPERLRRLSDSDPEAFADAVRPEYRDLGLGAVERDGRLVRALFFGLSVRDQFTQETADLRDLKQVRDRMLARVNAERRAKRLPPLRENALLDQAAQAHADDMIRRSYYGHESPEGTTAMERARRAGYGALRVGENIAEGPPTVATVMDEWMRSSTHREHILSLQLNEIGMGVAFGKNGRGYEIVWVQVFGAPMPGVPGRPERSGAPGSGAS